MFTFTQIIALVTMALLLVFATYTLWLRRKLAGVMKTNQELRTSMLILCIMLALFGIRAFVETVIAFVPHPSPVLAVISMICFSLLLMMVVASTLRATRLIRRAYAETTAAPPTKETP